MVYSVTQIFQLFKQQKQRESQKAKEMQKIKIALDDEKKTTSKLRATLKEVRFFST